MLSGNIHGHPCHVDEPRISPYRQVMHLVSMESPSRVSLLPIGEDSAGGGVGVGIHEIHKVV